MQWFDVDKAGLAKLLERRGKAFAIAELIQNAWDTNATKVDVTLVRVPGTVHCGLEVEDDDPDGFANLAHAFTLFAESGKKGDAEKRGRFNLGEKLVLALCTSAKIESTTGSVVFDKDGRKSYPKYRRPAGSKFSGVLRMTNDELAAALAFTRTLVPPRYTATSINGELLTPRVPVLASVLALPTEIADGEGVLRRSVRNTRVHFYETLPGETASIYEMGIPVVETGDKYHYDVAQKIPMGFDRDNVAPSYLRILRQAALNALHQDLTPAEATAPWVSIAAGGDEVDPDATRKVLDLRYGDKRVAYDPTDPEANKLAVAGGYTVVHGGSLSADEWKNAKFIDAIPAAGKVTPSPAPFSAGGAPLKLVPPEKWTLEMKCVVEHAHRLSLVLLNKTLTIQITNDVTWPFGATYGRADRHLILNLGRLGHDWFDNFGKSPAGTIAVEQLLIHEFGHDFSSDHLSSKYHDALCLLGAKLAAHYRTQAR